MKPMSKILLATTSLIALTVAARAQTLDQINQTVTGVNSLTSGNTSTLINSAGFGAVTLQAFQEATNTVNLGAASYTATTAPNSVTQSIASGGSLTLTSNNTNAGFSQNGAQLVQGFQGIRTDINTVARPDNTAGLSLTNGALVTVQQNSLSAITSTQSNRISAGYNTPAGSSFGIGQGTAAIQGQSLTPDPANPNNSLVVNGGFQNNAFNLNTATIEISGASATIGLAQNPGAVTATQTNFADAGQASPTFIDPAITALNQTVTANVNRIDSVSAATGSTLILDGTGTTVGKQSIGSSLDSFTVQNTARALTWNATSGSTGSGAYGSASGGTGDVSIQNSTQTVGLNFNAIVAGTSGTGGTPQSVNFGGTSSGLFEQTAIYGSTTSTGSGITITNQPTGGFANFGVAQGSTSDNPVNVSFVGTGSGAATVSSANPQTVPAQTASATLNIANVSGAANGNLIQSASINTATGSGTGTAGAAVGNGPQLSNFAGAVVQLTGSASLSNMDQTSSLASNSLTAGSVGADGLTLNQTGYQTKSANFNASPSAGTVNPGLSSNVLVAGVLASSTLGSNASISGSQQVLANSQNTFSATSSANGASGSPAQLNITQSLTLPQVGSTGQDQAYGGDNLASANALNSGTSGPGGNGSLSNGSQLGSINLNSATVTTPGANTQTTITQSAAGVTGDTLAVAGFNTASAAGRTASVTGYGQQYDVALNSVELGSDGMKNVTQTSGAATINTGNTLSVSETGASPFGSATIGGSSTAGVSQTLTASANRVNLSTSIGGSIVQTAGPITSTLNNSATATTATSAASSITGLIQTTSQSINTGE
jgi:hypothetical protein